MTEFKIALKRTAAVFAAIGVLTSAVYADVLGTHISAEQERIAPYTDYHKNVFNDSDVGHQTEHYVEYKPNGVVRPIVANGWSAYGKRTVLQAADVLRDMGYNPAVGMNADFFSFQTGVPMSNTVINGRIFTADSSWMPGIGFRSDGTAFCATFPIHTTITLPNGSGFDVECINKYRQPYALYLFNRDFGSETHSPGKGTDVVLANVSGDLKIGGEITATVESIDATDGSYGIPEGKMILSVSANASDELKGRLSGLETGQTITISTVASENEELWESAANAIGALGGKLITNGQLDYEDESAAPRSAVGIKADGSIIYYTLDGRQRGYSYGARKSTVARRLLELGCVEAISLDGGGSTSFAISEPDSDGFKTVNSPSDGALRACANFLFLTKPYPNGIPFELTMLNGGSYMLSGGSVTVAVSGARDSSYAQTAVPSDIEYSIEYDAQTPDGSGKSSYVDENGYLTVHGNGDVYVSAKSGEAVGEAAVTSVTTPDYIKLYDADYGYEIKELAIEPGTKVNLTAKSSWDGHELISDNSCYKWTLVSDGASIGTLDQNGTFVAADNEGAKGTLAVNAGICSVEIPVVLSGSNSGSHDTYPKISGGINSNSLNARIEFEGVQKDDVKVSVDAKAVDFEFKDGTVTYNLADESYHRICVAIEKDGRSAFRIFDSGRLSSVRNTFEDTITHWARDYISYLTKCGVVKGSLEDDNVILFNPDRSMKRVEFAIMMTNYLGINVDEYADVNLPFTDNDDIPWWAENNVKAVYSLGLMKGQLGQFGTAFNPNADINRMEFAISLNRLLPAGLYSEPITAADADEIPFWAEESMKTAVAQGIMSGYPDGTLKPFKSVSRAEAVKMVYNIFGM